VAEQFAVGGLSCLVIAIQSGVEGMIGHQHVGVDGATALLRILLQPAKLCSVVLAGEETRLAIGTALNQVQRHPGMGHTWPSWHVGLFLD
jgi:hypothetical protein